MKRHFEKQLDRLRSNIIKMSSLVDEQVNFAIKAIEENKKDYAKIVFEREEKVDEYDVKIEKICQKIFAINQPVAMDLRLIMSALTIINNLERIGDISVNIVENYLMLSENQKIYSRTKISEMTKIVREMMKNAVDSFIEEDAARAQKVIESDDLIDELNRQNHKILKQIMKENSEYIDDAVALLVISRQIERMADHGTNIAEDVYFIVEAQLVKHKYEEFLFGEESEDKEI